MRFFPLGDRMSSCYFYFLFEPFAFAGMPDLPRQHRMLSVLGVALRQQNLALYPAILQSLNSHACYSRVGRTPDLSRSPSPQTLHHYQGASYQVCFFRPWSVPIRCLLTFQTVPPPHHSGEYFLYSLISFPGVIPGSTGGSTILGEPCVPVLGGKLPPSLRRWRTLGPSHISM